MTGSLVSWEHVLIKNVVLDITSTVLTAVRSCSCIDATPKASLAAWHAVPSHQPCSLSFLVSKMQRQPGRDIASKQSALLFNTSTNERPSRPCLSLSGSPKFAQGYGAPRGDNPYELPSVDDLEVAAAAAAAAMQAMQELQQQHDDTSESDSEVRGTAHNTV